MEVSPEEARAYFDLHRDKLTDSEFFNSPAASTLQDIWVASHFGRAYAEFVAACRLEFDLVAAHEWDFRLLANDSFYPFQITEALEPGRKRGREYREIEREEIARTKLESWEPGTKNGPSWIAGAIERKVKKHYAGASELNLLVYANFPAYQLEYERVEACSAALADSFNSTWVITGNSLALLQSKDQTLGAIDEGWLLIRQS